MGPLKPHSGPDNRPARSRQPPEALKDGPAGASIAP